MSEDYSGPSRNQLLVLVVLGLILVVGLVVQFMPGGSDEPEGSSDEPSITVESPDDSNVAPPGSDDQSDPPGANAPQEVHTIAGEAVEYYTEWSYRDKGPNEWMTRLAKVSTGHYIQTLKETFSDSLDEQQWTWEEVEKDRSETRTEIIEVAQSEDVEGTDDRFTMVVTYQSSTRDKNTDWENGERLDLQVLVVRKGSTWAVDDILSMDDLPDEEEGGANA